MDFSEIWWVLYVNELESEKNFDHHSVLPVFEEQVRCHAPIYLSFVKFLYTVPGDGLKSVPIVTFFNGL